MRVRQVKNLPVQKVVAIEHHFRKEPVILTIKRRINKIAADVCLDGERQEIVGLWVQVEVGITSCPEAT